MKVLHLIQKSQLRGAEIFASQLSSHINNSGNTAIIVSLFGGDDTLPFNGSVTSLNGNPKGRFYDFKAWKKLAKIIKAEKPDIIQANAGDTLKYAVFSKIIHRWKQPVVFRNASTLSLYVKTLPERIWNNLLFSFADKIISVSGVSATDFSKLFPRHKHKVVTISIGIESSQLASDKNGRVNNRFVLNGQEIRIIHVGGFTFEKNHLELLEIFQLVLEKAHAATLYLIGDGPLRKQIEEIVRLKGLESKIKFYGYQKNPLDFIRAADVLVLPSLIEGLPGVLLEAFYCKTPVVAYDVGGIKEIVINNETGRLIERGDKDSFANGILEACLHTSQNNQLIENAHKLVVSKYMNTEVVKQFLTVYDSLVSQ